MQNPHCLLGLVDTFFLRDFFTVLALSFHAVFEGLAVGLEESSPDVWTMFGAIATHKFIITFCVRFNLLMLINESTKLDPVCSTVRYEVMKLCGGSE